MSSQHLSLVLSPVAPSPWAKSIPSALCVRGCPPELCLRSGAVGAAGVVAEEEAALPPLVGAAALEDVVDGLAEGAAEAVSAFGVGDLGVRALAAAGDGAEEVAVEEAAAVAAGKEKKDSCVSIERRRRCPRRDADPLFLDPL